MPDSDQSLEILIKLLSDTKGAEAVQSALDKAKASTEDLTTHLPEGSEAWEKYKGALNQTAKESGNLESAHEALNLALGKLQLPVQELTPLLHDLFNPAAFAVDGLAAAWEIWNRRVEEGVKILSGFQLPDLSEHTQKISEAATALNGYTKELAGVVGQYNSIEAASDRVIRKIQEETRLREALAKAHGAPNTAIWDIEQQGAQAEIAEKDRRRSSLASSAALKRLIAGDIKIASQDEDDRSLADAKALADKAKIGLAEAQSRLEDIQNLQGESALQHPKDAYQYASRYGVNAPFTEAQAIEQRIIEDANVIIRKYQKMVTEQPSRRALREQKEKLMADAGTEQGEADVLGKQIPEEEKELHTKRLPELEKALGITNQASTEQSVQDYLGAIGRLNTGRGTAADDQLRRHFSELLESSKTLDQSTYALLQKLIAHNGEMAGRISKLEHDHDQTAHRTDRPVN